MFPVNSLRWSGPDCHLQTAVPCLVPPANQPLYPGHPSQDRFSQHLSCLNCVSSAGPARDCEPWRLCVIFHSAALSLSRPRAPPSGPLAAAPTEPPGPSGASRKRPARLWWQERPAVARVGLGPTTIRLEQRCLQAPQAQTVFLTQAPLHGSTPGALCGGAVCPVPQFLVTSAVEPILPAPPAGSTQASDGGWSLPRPPQAAVPATQLASGQLPAMARPHPHGAARSGGPACWHPTASPRNTCSGTSVYEKYRHWQHYRPLARRHLPQSPDAEALSCFVIPVLRTLAHLKPTVTLEEGLLWGVQEWQRHSNSDRRIYYEMAGKLMEFEAEEAKQMQTAQWIMAAQGLPPPVPLRPGPWAPQPQNGARSKEGQRRGPARQHPATPVPARPARRGADGDTPEAVGEYTGTREWLLGPGCPAEGAPGREGERPAPSCHRERRAPTQTRVSSATSMSCVWTMLHPCFLADVLSPEPQLDLCTLAEELEQEEGLSLAQEEGVQAPPSHGTPRLDSRPSETETGQDSQRHGHGPGPQRGDSDQACPPEAGWGQHQMHSLEDAGMSRPKAFAASPGRQGSPPWKTDRPRPVPQAWWHTFRSPGPSLTTAPGETCPASEPLGPTDRPSEDEEELPSLAFLLASQHVLPSWGLPQSPTPGSDLLCPGVPQACSPQRPGLSPAGPPAAKASSRPTCAAPASAERTPLPGASLGVTGSPALALGLGCPSQPQKRRQDPFVTGKSSKRHCSQ
ncbi:hypothetical protein MC885_005519 [Smutsia gigantea]|nr:hypothetical protein MC885_005519 [Smutsia gigantea]